jgi:hypothetical protein
MFKGEIQMKSLIVFPETAWTKSSLGFSGIAKLLDEISINIKIDVIREYGSIIFVIEELDKDTIHLIQMGLPNNFMIFGLIDGQWNIISNNAKIQCDVNDEKFKKISQESQLPFSFEHLFLTEFVEIREIPEQFLAEMNELCNNFIASEKIPETFSKFISEELNIEKLNKAIHIEDQFRPKLIGVLVDIKSIWCALEYNSIQLARNTSEEDCVRFKRYILISDTIVRIRALWERLISLAILVDRPEKFDKISGNKSKRRAFIKEFKNSTNSVTKLIWDYSYSLEFFENKFRTPELHKIGRTIRWASK